MRPLAKIGAAQRGSGAPPPPLLTLRTDGCERASAALAQACYAATMLMGKEEHAVAPYERLEPTVSQEAAGCDRSYAASERRAADPTVQSPNGRPRVLLCGS